jgi:hypothetical protein
MNPAENTQKHTAGRPREGGKACDLWAITLQNTVAMKASATFA